MKIWNMAGPVILGGLAVALPGLPGDKIDLTHYFLKSKRIKTPVRMMVLSDLHDEYFGLNMEKLALEILKEKPDLIVMPGDMVQEDDHKENAFTLFRQLRGIPMFYCTGNHEERHPDVNLVLKQLQEFDIQILDHQAVLFQKGDTFLEIAGISCRKHESDYHVEEIDRLFTTKHYRILLSHRPHWVNLYRNLNCQMVISGHAHGGQWRIPAAKISAFAPQQGIFPKYTQGMHVLGRTVLVVSRGLVKQYHGIPRLYNNPEIVLVHLLPDK